MFRRTPTRLLLVILIGLTGVVFAAAGGCAAQPSPQPGGDGDGDIDRPAHETRFIESFDDPNYKGTESCLTCHSDRAEDIMETAHWNWSGSVTNIEGLEGEVHGKIDLINDY